MISILFFIQTHVPNNILRFNCLFDKKNGPSNEEPLFSGVGSAEVVLDTLLINPYIKGIYHKVLLL